MGSPNADGNTMKIVMPPTEPVADVKGIEQALIFSEIAGKKNWHEVLSGVFGKDYPDQDVLRVVVETSVTRIKAGFVPTAVMEIFREQQRFNNYAACK